MSVPLFTKQTEAKVENEIEIHFKTVFLKKTNPRMTSNY